MIEAFKIQPHRDKKLEELKDLIREKVKTPINEGNKKVIIFNKPLLIQQNIYMIILLIGA